MPHNWFFPIVLYATSRFINLSCMLNIRKLHSIERLVEKILLSKTSCSHSNTIKSQTWHEIYHKGITKVQKKKNPSYWEEGSERYSPFILFLFIKSNLFFFLFVCVCCRNNFYLLVIIPILFLSDYLKKTSSNANSFNRV